MCRQFTNIKILHSLLLRYRDSLLAEWYGDRIIVNAKLSATVAVDVKEVKKSTFAQFIGFRFVYIV